MCLHVCGQKVATIADELYEALNHTAQPILVLQIIAINREFLGTIKRKRGNSHNQKVFLIMSHLASSFINQGTSSGSAFCLYWDRQSVILVLICELEKFSFAYIIKSC